MYKRQLYDREIRLIVVSKTQNSEKIITLNNLGQTDFGENYVDEAREKINFIKNNLKHKLPSLYMPLFSDEINIFASYIKSKNIKPTTQSKTHSTPSQKDSNEDSLLPCWVPAECLLQPLPNSLPCPPPPSNHILPPP